jgi:hypothetical protein
MHTNLETKKTARLAGLLFLLWIISGFYDMFYVSPKIFVSGDPVASAQNILKYETLFRTGIFSGLITNTIWVLLVWVFYQLFKSVNERYAKLLVASVLVQVPVAFVHAGLSITAVITLKGEILKSFELAQRQDIAMAFLQINEYSISIILWSLALSVIDTGLSVRFHSTFFRHLANLKWNCLCPAKFCRYCAS